jgi:aminoglycoside/choline kinase family phosphotransferase
MITRETAAEEFLARHGWHESALVPLAGDASFRSYWRIANGPTRAVLMDMPPDKLDMRPFLAVDAHLRKLGYSAPEIYAADLAEGFALLEDLGDATIAAKIAAGSDEAGFYALATDWLIDLHRRGADATPSDLPRYDDARLLEEVGRFLLWYVPAVTGAPPSAQAEREFNAVWRLLLPVARWVPESLVYRDFHIENLIALPRPGRAALGLLDFQDSVAGPITYDLASLLEDARRDVPAALADAMRARYLAAFPALDPFLFEASFATMAAHRHVKCLGLFVRLAQRDAKPGYLAHIPRLWRMLEHALEHPKLAALGRWLDTYVPAERRVAPLP